MMDTSYCIKKPIMSSIIAVIFFLFVIIISGAVSSITGLSSKITLFMAFSILGMLLAVYLNKIKYWQYYGFRSLKYLNTKNKLLFVPLFIIALLPLTVGLSNDLRISDYFYIVFLWQLLHLPKKLCLEVLCLDCFKERVI